MDAKLEQQLWDFVYGLLSDDESAEMVERISSDPALARAYAEVRLEADMLAAAARVPHTPIPLHDPAAVEVAPAASDDAWRQTASRGNFVNTVVAIAAVLLLSVTGYFYFQPNSPFANVAWNDVKQPDRYFTSLTLPGHIQEGEAVVASARVFSRDDQSDTANAEMSWQVRTPSGELLLEKKVAADRRGYTSFAIPEQVVESGNWLHVRAGSSPPIDVALAPQRAMYATHVTTDKRDYSPGERVRFRSVTLDRFARQPLNEGAVQFSLLAPDNQPVGEVVAEVSEGVAEGEVLLADNSVGGQYLLRASGDSPQREVRVNVITQATSRRFSIDTEFGRDSYVAGETVRLDLRATRADGRPAAGAKVKIEAYVNGQEFGLTSADAVTSRTGAYKVQLPLPDSLAATDNRLTIAIQEQGVQETVVKSIPIRQRTEVEFYPESGEFVAGVRNRVYFEATGADGSAAHIDGTIVDSNGTQLAEVETLVNGRGRISLTPELGETYFFEPARQLAKSVAVTSLPTPVESGVALSADADSFAPGAPLSFTVATPQPARIYLEAVCRGVSVGAAEVNATSDSVELSVADKADGVIRVTAFRQAANYWEPVAERLVYRHPTERLQVEIELDRLAEASDKASFEVAATDETGQAVSAVLGVSVAGDQVVDRERASISHFFSFAAQFEGDNLSRAIEDARIMLGEESDSALALDLFLASRGWRRIGPGETTSVALATRDMLFEPVAEPLLLNNQSSVSQAEESDRVAWVQNRQLNLDLARRVVLFGAIGLLLAGALSAILKLAEGRAVTLALSSSVACLVLALFWTSARIEADGQVAYSVFGSVDVGVAQSEVQTRGDSSPTQLGDRANEELAAPGAAIGEATPSDVVNKQEADSDAGAAPAAGNAKHPSLPGGGPTEPKMDSKADGDAQAQKQTRRQQGQAQRAQAPPGGAGAARAASKASGGGAGRAEAADESVDRPPNDAKKREPGAKQPQPLAGETPDVKPPQSPRGGGEKTRGNPRLAANKERARAIDRGAAKSQANAPAQTELAFGPPQVGASASASAAGGVGGVGGVGGFSPPIPQAERFNDAFQRRKSGGAEQLDRVSSERNQFVRSFPRPRARTTPGAHYWNPRLKLSALGREQVTINPLDDSMRYRILVEAHGAGRVGDALAIIEPRGRLVMTPTLPDAVTAGDDLELPIAFYNRGAAPASVKVTLAADALFVVEPGSKETEIRSLGITGEKPEVRFLRVKSNGQMGTGELRLEFQGGGRTEVLRHVVRVDPAGYPHVQTVAGIIRGNEQLNFHLPEQAQAQWRIDVAAYPSAAAEISSGIEGLGNLSAYRSQELLENLAANYHSLDLLNRRNVADPNAVRLAKRNVARAQQRLSYAQTARPGAGKDAESAKSPAQQPGFRANSENEDALAGLGDTIVDERLADLFLTQRPLSKTVVEEQLKLRQNQPAAELAKRLVGRQSADGSLAAGENAPPSFELTIAAAQIWMKQNQYGDQAKKALEWIAEQRQADGGFGSPSATILAADALGATDAPVRRVPETGVLKLQAGEQTISSVEFNNEQEAIRLSNNQTRLTPGDNTWEMVVEPRGEMPYLATLRYWFDQPPDGAKDAAKDGASRESRADVSIVARLAATKVTAGRSTALDLQIDNQSGETHGYALAVGLPAGCTISSTQLGDLQKQQQFDYYEVGARHVTIVWREMPAGQRKLALDLLPQIPGKLSGPPSYFHRLDAPTKRRWIAPMTLQVHRPESTE
ncbi:MAG: hypothetical protein QGG36_08230 [Pirellulaceae bacterium]|jgi:hypothetical protein|nr:hypothetical protein [Pirellulaceae bacterium]